MSDIELSILAPATYRSHFHGLHVNNSRDCPSLRCKVDHPHRYQEPTPIPPHRPSLPIIYIRRFDPSTDPYPRTNIWEIRGGVPDHLEEPVYIDGYGELTLSDVPIPIEDEDWRILAGRSTTGAPVVLLAMRKEKRDKRGSPWSIRHLISFLSCRT
jgi:hypothetical protein